MERSWWSIQRQRRVSPRMELNHQYYLLHFYEACLTKCPSCLVQVCFPLDTSLQWVKWEATSLHAMGAWPHSSHKCSLRRSDPLGQNPLDFRSSFSKTPASCWRSPGSPPVSFCTACRRLACCYLPFPRCQWGLHNIFHRVGVAICRRERPRTRNHERILFFTCSGRRI